MARKAPKGQLAKSEAKSIRFDPKLNYLLELMAKAQHRTVSAVIEWAVEKAVKDKEGCLWQEPGDNGTPVFLGDLLWDAYEHVRLAKLAVYAPDLMSFEQEKIWKFIIQHSHLWEGYGVATFDDEEATLAEIRKNGWKFVKKHLRFWMLEVFWEDIKVFEERPLLELAFQTYLQTLKPMDGDAQADREQQAYEEIATYSAFKNRKV